MVSTIGLHMTCRLRQHRPMSNIISKIFVTGGNRVLLSYQFIVFNTFSTISTEHQVDNIFLYTKHITSLIYNERQHGCENILHLKLFNQMKGKLSFNNLIYLNRTGLCNLCHNWCPCRPTSHKMRCLTNIGQR